jgi:hypothetical protein
MDTNHLGDALLGLLLLHGSNDSNNDSTTPTTNDSNNKRGPTPTSNGNMDVTPTKEAEVYNKRGHKLHTKEGIYESKLHVPSYRQTPCCQTECQRCNLCIVGGHFQQSKCG